jgi:hypothetical protein
LKTRGASTATFHFGTPRTTTRCLKKILIANRGDFAAVILTARKVSNRGGLL